METMCHTRRILEAAERRALHGTAEDCLVVLRSLCLDDFALVMHAMPDERYPGLSSHLPAMAPADVQRRWTGADGLTLLRQRVGFFEKLRRHFAQITGRRLEGTRILDYGCGYGMMLRLLYYLTDPCRIAGCDPGERSIRLCEDAGIRCRLDVTDYLPATLPYDDETFDLIVAFSVFTHTSRRAAATALEAIRPVVKSDGLLALTIRPREFWRFNQRIPDEEKPALERAHDETGFAFRPGRKRLPIDGDVTFGQTTMKIEMIEELCPKWKMVDYDRSLLDPFQLVVLLQPRATTRISAPIPSRPR